VFERDRVSERKRVCVRERERKGEREEGTHRDREKEGEGQKEREKERTRERARKCVGACVREFRSNTSVRATYVCHLGPIGPLPVY